jgi:hypothetical protein
MEAQPGVERNFRRHFTKIGYHPVGTTLAGGISLQKVNSDSTPVNQFVR